MSDGWIKLHRKLLENNIFSSEKGLKIWIWCLLKANHRDKDKFIGTQKITISTGTFMTGSFKAREELGIAVSTIWNWLNILEKEGLIEIKKTNKYSIIIVKNWHKHQVIETKSETNQQTNGKQIGTTNNDKNVKNDKNIVVASPTPSEQVKTFFSSKGLQDKVADDLSEKYGINNSTLKAEITKFVHYWTEPTKSGNKQRWELQPTFEIKRRLTTWLNNIKNFNKSEKTFGDAVKI